MEQFLGTRTTQNFRKERVQSSSREQSMTRDVGLSKTITTNLTYSAAGTITGVATNFNNFAVGDPIFVAGTNKNDGEFTITAIAGDTSSITVDPPPKNEGPINSTVRTV